MAPLTAKQERELARKLDGWWCDGQLDITDLAEPDTTSTSEPLPAQG